MIEKISWASYAYAMAIAVVIYYLIILTCFYRLEFLNQLDKAFKMLHRNTKPKGKLASYQNHAPESPPDSETNVVATEVINAIKYYAENEFIKEEVVAGLTSLVKDYAAPINTESKQLLNNIIIAKCEEYCSIRLDDGDVKRIWMS